MVGVSTGDYETSKKTKALTAEETTQLYVGNTASWDTQWGKANYTWTADGKVLGILDKKDGKKAVADGTWTVKDNEFCYSVVWKSSKSDKGSDWSPCVSWFKVGKVIWNKNGSGNGKWTGDVCDCEYRESFSKGDKVSGRMETVKASLEE
ncbi:DUF995 domain-containing protein [Rhizobium grahamii]|uniref:DUF995 domain-containing protein n=1 Tax=Rhizobium grahamii TaxID=1120045 RepID=A0A370KHR1_9HYPH|nr:DUF995 domain-containing protein [Rhizobium grahamii]RDJ05048.1 hypothetical protein B5K06_26095 [Rhizobium grahamii]